jgi:adenosylcobinamide-phosphate synthase
VPHPAVLMGRAVGWFDDLFNTGQARKAKGVIAGCPAAVRVSALGWAVRTLPGGPVLEVCPRGRTPGPEKPRGSCARRRRRAAPFAGGWAPRRFDDRRTGHRELDEAAVARAAIESAAENLSDGVVAPAFWFLPGGLPGILLYKIVNTADSMIGHRTERHGDFGWAAARLDDILNWLPRA